MTPFSTLRIKLSTMGSTTQFRWMAITIWDMIVRKNSPKKPRIPMAGAIDSMSSFSVDANSSEPRRINRKLARSPRLTAINQQLTIRLCITAGSRASVWRRRVCSSPRPSNIDPAPQVESGRGHRCQSGLARTNGSSVCIICVR